MNQSLIPYQQMTQFLAKSLPKQFTVMLFDVTDESYPVIETSNWSESPSDHIRSYVRQIVSSNAQTHSDSLRKIVAVDDESLGNVSVHLIYEGEKIVGVWCLSLDLTVLLRMNEFTTQWLGGVFADTISVGSAESVNYTNAELSDIDKIVRGYGVPADEMTPSDRKEVFMDLYDAGVFRLKGSITKTAQALDMSEQSVYRYLSQMKKHRM